MAKVGVFKNIKPEDISINEFVVNKRWSGINETNHSSSFGVLVHGAVYPTNVLVPISASLAENEPTNPDGTIRKVMYYSVDHLYYKNEQAPATQFGLTDPRLINKQLFESASVISIPQSMYGEKINPGSVVLNDGSISGSIIRLKDDARGNIIDTTIPSASLVATENLQAYYGFNERFMDAGIQKSGSVNDRSVNKNRLNFKNISFNPGIATSGKYGASSGTAASFNSSSYMYTKNTNNLNFKNDEDFAISFWVDMPISQSSINSVTLNEPFDNNNVGWEVTQSGGTSGSSRMYLTGGALIMQVPGAGNTIEYTSPGLFNIGETYTIQYEVGSTSSMGAAAPFVGIGFASNFGTGRSGSGVYSDVVVADSASLRIQYTAIFGATNTTMSLENLTVTSDADPAEVYIISKEGNIEKEYLVNRRGRPIGQKSNVSQRPARRAVVSRSFDPDHKVARYPYKVTTAGTGSLYGKIGFYRYDGTNNPYIESTTMLTGSQGHVVVQRSGSEMQIWVDGLKEASGSDTITDNINNENSLFIGAKNSIDGTKFSGSLDEIRFYDKALSSAEIWSLSSNDWDSGSAYNTNRVGNAFYETGHLIISSPMPKYKYVALGHSASFDYSYIFTGSVDNPGTSSYWGFDLEFNGYHRIYENEVVCRADQNEFNATLNPSTVKYGTSQLYQNFTTHSAFHPYVTTIGLYDDHGQLLAVGKLGKALPKRSDIDTTFIVKYDT